MISVASLWKKGVFFLGIDHNVEFDHCFEDFGSANMAYHHFVWKPFHLTTIMWVLFDTVPTFEHLYLKILNICHMCRKRGHWALCDSFCFTWIDEGIADTGHKSTLKINRIHSWSWLQLETIGSTEYSHVNTTRNSPN